MVSGRTAFVTSFPEINQNLILLRNNLRCGNSGHPASVWDGLFFCNTLTCGKTFIEGVEHGK